MGNIVQNEDHVDDAKRTMNVKTLASRTTVRVVKQLSAIESWHSVSLSISSSASCADCNNTETRKIALL